MLAMSQSVFRLPPTPRSFKLVELDLTLKWLLSLGPMFAQTPRLPPTIQMHCSSSPNLSLTFSLGSGISKLALQPFTHAKIQTLRIKSVYAGGLWSIRCTVTQIYARLQSLTVSGSHVTRNWRYCRYK
jgi:hypothetical protein